MAARYPRIISLDFLLGLDIQWPVWSTEFFFAPFQTMLRDNRSVYRAFSVRQEKRFGDVEGNSVGGVACFQ